MFDLFGSRSNLKDLLSELPEPAMYTSYPVVRETCSCGAFTEAVDREDGAASAHFAKWRTGHKCKPVRAANPADAGKAPSKSQ